MARLLVFTDLPPDDADWKGALSWRIIMSLAESHHEVLVLTATDLNKISITHPRLTVTQPVNSWRVDQFPKLAKILMNYRPQIIHTFALAPLSSWPSLSVWPLLNGMCSIVPGLKRFSTLFDESDCRMGDPSFVWHQGSARITVFSDRHRKKVSAALGRPVDIVPLDLEFENLGVETSGSQRTLIPAPVSEWEHPEDGLRHLSEFLQRHPETSARLVGGWGTWTQSRRREGWRILENVAAQLSLSEPLSLTGFIDELRAAGSLWLEPLHRDSWKFLLCSQLGGQMNKQLLVSSPMLMSLTTGSTANSLSRLYTER